MGRARHFLYQSFQQRLDHIRSSFRLEVDVWTLSERVDNQRQSEGMPVGKIEDGRMLVGGYPLTRHVSSTFFRGKIAQRQETNKRLPARVGTPAQRRRIGAG